MSLTAALSAGRSALAASQLGIQVAGNNMANAATRGYSRQTAELEALRGGQTGAGDSAGRGVRVTGVRRQVDDALAARMLGTGSDASAAATQQRILEAVEQSLGELGDFDLSNELSGFFQVLSERGNGTKTNAAVVQQGDKLAGFIRGLRGDLVDQRAQLDAEIGGGVAAANVLLTTIARYNTAISSAGGDGANALRDHRDEALNALSELMEITVVDRGLGGVDVLVGSAPVVLGEKAKALEARRTTIDGKSIIKVATAGDRGQELTVAGGSIGSMLLNRDGAVEATLSTLDRVAAQLIFEVNKLHSTGANSAGLTSATSNLRVGMADRTIAMNGAGNETFTQLPFAARNGGFVVQVRQQATGAVTAVRVNVDLDGVANDGSLGTGDDSTAEQVRARIGAIGGLSARFTAEGKLEVTAAAGFDFVFTEDSSGVLGAMGMNAYFKGTGAETIGVRAELLADSGKLAAGRYVGGVFTENGTALALAQVQRTGAAGLSGESVMDYWRDAANRVGGATAAAKSNASARSLVHEAIVSQRDAISGVNIDEESISLLDFQRQYQAAARVISTVDELTQALFAMI